ncbi:hypothetical protein LCGC14_0698150 [marine sediment metagenome]|uniref:Peptidase metallopeptidase domain-containing protein n=1 Tax=marine sediment metagenome TaxID=412755 RepID=A0A0F9TRD8_9ZZZZ|nr:matrixin family metalloprotease [Phycisphaerae bacterium]HDZ44856.1 matrixin family metalloprotease [Phycisphaerae bacterium]
MRTPKLFLVVIAVCLFAGPALAWELTNLGAAGGWDDINKSTTVTTVLDASDFTADLASVDVESALLNAFGTWDDVAAAPNLNFEFKDDDGGNYDIFDGPNDSGGPPWFNGTTGTLDQSSNWRYANIVVGGWLPASYFGSPYVLAVTWTGQLYGGGGKPQWHSEVFFNDAWNWTNDGEAADVDLLNGLPNLLIDLETVALHEFGHTIGLGHENGEPSVMASFYGGTERTLLADDIDGVTALYSNRIKGGGGGGNGGGRGNGRGPNRFVAGDAEWFLTGVTYLGDGYGAAVPEPVTLLVMAAAGLPLLLKRKRKSRA